MALGKNTYVSLMVHNLCLELSFLYILTCQRLSSHDSHELSNTILEQLFTSKEYESSHPFCYSVARCYYFSHFISSSLTVFHKPRSERQKNVQAKVNRLQNRDDFRLSSVKQY